MLLNYLLVGVTEELGDFIAVLEATLPRFFNGATQLFNNGMAVSRMEGKEGGEFGRWILNRKVQGVRVAQSVERQTLDWKGMSLIPSRSSWRAFFSRASFL